MSDLEIYLPTFSDSESDQEYPNPPTEASVYFVVQHRTDLSIYRIPDDLPPKPSKRNRRIETDPTTGLLKPQFVLKDQVVSSHCCAAVGSVIYVYGGGIDLADRGGISMTNEVYFVDTAASSEEGWKKGKPMNFARAGAVCFSVNNKIYAYGGTDLFTSRKLLPMEVYDTDEDEDGWKIKGWEADWGCLDVAVYKEANQVILYTREDKLLTYDVEKDTMEPCAYPVVIEPPIAIAVLGHILYMGSYSDDDKKGNLELTGYDLNNVLSPAKVTGLDKLMDNRSDYRLPKKVDYIDGCCSFYNGFKLIPIGEKKLAVVWTLHVKGLEVCVNCLKIEIDVQITDPNQLCLAAQSGSFSSHKVSGTSVDHYLPVQLLAA